MKTRTSAPETVVARPNSKKIVPPPTDTQPSNAALLERIQQITTETLNHPQVVNKTEGGVASRVARLLNQEGVFKCTAHRFWTGAHVLMVSIPIKK